MSEHDAIDICYGIDKCNACDSLYVMLSKERKKSARRVLGWQDDEEVKQACNSTAVPRGGANTAHVAHEMKQANIITVTVES